MMDTAKLCNSFCAEWEYCKYAPKVCPNCGQGNITECSEYIYTSDKSDMESPLGGFFRRCDVCNHCWVLECGKPNLLNFKPCRPLDI